EGRANDGTIFEIAKLRRDVGAVDPARVRRVVRARRTGSHEPDGHESGGRLVRGAARIIVSGAGTVSVGTVGVGAVGVTSRGVAGVGGFVGRDARGTVVRELAGRSIRGIHTPQHQSPYEQSH